MRLMAVMPVVTGPRMAFGAQPQGRVPDPDREARVSAIILARKLHKPRQVERMVARMSPAQQVSFLLSKALGCEARYQPGGQPHPLITMVSVGPPHDPDGNPTTVVIVPTQQGAKAHAAIEDAVKAAGGEAAPLRWIFTFRDNQPSRLTYQGFRVVIEAPFKDLPSPG